MNKSMVASLRNLRQSDIRRFVNVFTPAPLDDEEGTDAMELQ